ncbi:hypothetical protein G7046_g9085 [Stylonectria norvegica]|nr:hypothetical protein G7046_g9085 [Stylonectria norvegica]
MLFFQFALAALTAGPALVAGQGSLSCPANSPLSCQNTTATADTCCFNYPGGQLLLTQFWDSDPATGPSDSWTVHGLWPDNCDGTYEATCDPNRQYTNISEILSAAAPSTLSYMQTYWKDYKGNDESFWEHEFGKHGTCISTLEPSCYANYKSGQEVVDFFNKAVAVFKTLPSYTWLTAAGIVPSTSKTYTLAAIQAALKGHHGHDVVINCDGSSLNELWYQFNVQGSAQSGKYVAVDPVGSKSTCPSTGIKWMPKSGSGTAPSTSTLTAPGPPPTGSPQQLSGKGTVNIKTSSSSSAGFLISGGQWYNGGGTPATFTATPATDGSSFALSTSKGKCAVQNSVLTCASSVSAATSFGYDGSYLTYGSSNLFYAATSPAGTTQTVVYTTSKAISLQMSWIGI